MLLNLPGDSDLNPTSTSPSGNRHHFISHMTSCLQRHLGPGSTEACAVTCQLYHFGVIYFTFLFHSPDVYR